MRKYKGFRILKKAIGIKFVLLFSLSVLIANIYVSYLNFKYDLFYKNVPKNIKANAIVVSEIKEKENNEVYEIKIDSGKYKNKRFYLYASKDSKIKYGDLIEIDASYIMPNESRNYKGFNYREYLKTKKIYGILKTKSNVKVLEEKKLNFFLIISNNIRKTIISKTYRILPEDTGGLLNGILLGEKDGIEKDIIESFKNSNLSHMIVVSGTHTSYIILGITYIFNKSKVPKKWHYISIILILILFMFITNFAISITRACLTSIILLSSYLLYRKPDIWTSLAVSILIILINNPFVINDIGFQLSYLGVLGILILSKNIKKFLNNVNEIISNFLSATISAQIAIMPIIAYRFNTVSLTFLFSNILAYPLLGISIILGFTTNMISLISYELAKMFAIPLNLSLRLLILISKITSGFRLSSITVKTPYILSIIIFYILILAINYIYSVYRLKTGLSFFQRKVLMLFTKKNLRHLITIILVLIIIFNLYSIVPKELKIFFIDVGQGDASLIITPMGKSILVDGGEDSLETLVPYLLDRRIKKVDYIIVSHFDTDHVGGLLKVMEELKVKAVVISKQNEKNENYENFKKIVKAKKINVIYVEQGDRLDIEKGVYFDILWPNSKSFINERILNNNSIVCKLQYKDFSMLFTGDIEEIAERDILQNYEQRLSQLNSTILKVAHHGSKTSSTQNFLNAVKPIIALIGVEENNKFGHPNYEVIERLENLHIKIYRTDLMGEIEVRVNKKGKILVNKRLN